MEKIQTHVRDRFVGSRHAALLLPVVLALGPLPVLPGELSLLPGKSLFRPLHGGGPLRIRMDPRSVGEGGEGGHPEIEADRGGGSWFRLGNLLLCLQGDRPPARLPGHGGVFEIALDLSGDPDLDPSHLGEKDPGKESPSLRVPGRKIDLDLEGIGIPEGLPLALTLEPGEAFI